MQNNRKLRFRNTIHKISKQSASFVDSDRSIDKLQVLNNLENSRFDDVVFEERRTLEPVQNNPKHTKKPQSKLEIYKKAHIQPVKQALKLFSKLKTIIPE